ETQRSLAEMTATTEETLSVSGILLSKTFGQQANAIEKFRGQNKRLAALQIRQAMVGRWFFMIIGTIFSIMPAFVYWLAGTLAANGSPDAPSAGTIVAFTTLQSRLFFPIGQLLNIQVEIQGALALFDRIFEYLDLPIDIKDAPNAQHLASDKVRGEVTFNDVSFTYKRDEPSVLSGLFGKEGSENGNGKEKEKRPVSPEPVAISIEEPVARTTLNHVS